MGLTETREKRSLRELFLCFWGYAVIGWCYEVFLEVIVYRWGFSNRGVLFGPYCPVYGVGAIAFLLCFGRIMKSPKLPAAVKPLVLFAGCAALATLIELIASYILEAATGEWPWQTYADYKYNYQARIALSTSVRFGLGGLAFLYIVQPAFDKALSKLPEKAQSRAAAALLVIVSADAVYTIFIKTI